MNLGSDVEALRALEADPRFGELNDYVPPLSLVRAFGVARDEVAHSRVLARLLDPRRHRGAVVVLGALLRELADRPSVDEHFADMLRTAAAAGLFERVAVHRERLLIDVVVEVVSPVVDLVVGIENKTDAGEQTEQIARYQAALARAYPGRTGWRTYPSAATSYIDCVMLSSTIFECTRSNTMRSRSDDHRDRWLSLTSVAAKRTPSKTASTTSSSPKRSRSQTARTTTREPQRPAATTGS